MTWPGAFGQTETQTVFDPWVEPISVQLHFSETGHHARDQQRPMYGLPLVVSLPNLSLPVPDQFNGVRPKQAKN
ncbi:MAG: hypothetical protein ABJQ70_19695 [Roseobacter sp.]